MKQKKAENKQTNKTNKQTNKQKAFLMHPFNWSYNKILF